MAIPLPASDEPKRYSIQLYHRTATQVDLSGKRVLEVGSATAAEPRTSCAPCTRPPTRDWT